MPSAGAPAPVDDPAISVLMPVHDAAATLDEQLDALAGQDFRLPWELVIADNGSTDGTRDVIEARRAGFPAPIRLIDAGASRGAAFARNAAIRAARSDRLAFCDGDDRVGPQWLEGAYEGLDRADVVGGPLRRHTVPFDPDSPLLPFHSVSDDSIVASNVAMRRAPLERAGGYDAAFSGYGREDHELAVRLWKIGATFAYEPRMLVHYRLTSDQWVFIRKIYSSSRADVVIWRRHPETYPGRQGRGFVLREALSLPVNLVRAARGGGVRRMARVGVELAARARDMLGPRRPLEPARLLTTMTEETPEIPPRARA